MSRKKARLYQFFFIVFSLSVFLVAQIALAAIVPEAGKDTGSYGLNDFVRLGINVANWILGIVGSLALLFFIYGGFMLLISGGSSEKVEHGKKIISGAIMGLIIVFCSYMIIKFSMQALGLNWQGTTLKPGAYSDPSSSLCVTNFGTQGYSCMDEANGDLCKSNLCPGAANIKCCKPKTTN